MYGLSYKTYEVKSVFKRVNMVFNNWE